MNEPRPEAIPEVNPEAHENPEEIMKKEEAPAQTTQPDDAAARLAEREAAVAQRERRLLAREAMEAKGLPMELLKYFDYSSDAALENSFSLANLIASAWPAPAPMPKQSKPPMPPFATYTDRARLFAEDPAAYREMTAKSE